MRRDRLKTVAMTDCARHRFDIMLLVLLLALAGVVFAGLALGSSSIGASDVVAYAMGNASDMAVNVLANVRVPRVLGGVLAGAALAEAGALIQATLNNPLASSNIIGVNAGSGLFVLLFAAWLRWRWACRQLVRFWRARFGVAGVLRVVVRGGLAPDHRACRHGARVHIHGGNERDSHFQSGCLRERIGVFGRKPFGCDSV